MIMDNLLVFDPAGTAVTTTADSTNILDFSVARDMGAGEGAMDLDLVVQVNTAFTAAGAATMSVTLSGAPDNGSGSPGAYTILAVSDVIGKATLVPGYELLRMCLPLAREVMPRFLKLTYTVATGPMTAGKVNAAIMLNRQASIAYPSGYANTYV